MAEPFPPTKSQDAHAILQSDFRMPMLSTNQISRCPCYPPIRSQDAHTTVRGHVQGDVITIQAPIANNLDEGYQHMMCVPDEMSKNYDGIKPAKTEMQVVERGYYDDEPATKVLLTPHTGRRHQLRVHCSHIGHTIVGDYTYSLRKDTKPYRMMLHAYRLVIPIPDCHLDVVAPDTFLTEIDVKWKPTEKILSMTAIQ
ncbi:RNA pseudouridylate synthase domain-containing protein 1-like [Saccoglossus kowalevskii]|uniref:RNA pseudouridylate synthase domain-containing protein 1-like n=1 Tax=Saccoglossus kowalevskii TaxID=10224 RepID=A0ABM0MKN9_SACKO|nr:PREDICTED: RNA pseudouridylate synthase domain-containing protein 1-like [Saccoglossus kowalevskii]